VAVARAGSFTQAAQSLEIPKSTLSARISQLEQRMGLPLLKRSTRKVELTEAGRLYFNRADALVSEAGLLHEQLGHLLREPQGLLRLSVPVDFAHEFIAPYLGEFCERFPLIQLSFDVTPRKVNLISERFDVAIRAGKRPDSGLVQRLLAMFSGGLYAAPAYVVRHGKPPEPADLARRQCLRFPPGFDDVWELRHADEMAAQTDGDSANGATIDGNTPSPQSRSIRVNGRIASNSLGLNLRLALHGFGIAALPDALAAPYTAQGRLQALLPGWQTRAVPVYAFTANKLLPARAQAFIDFLKEKLAGLAV
jgi:transcriptional regulatory protein